MADPTRYELLRDLTRLELHLTSNDISDANASTLFDEVLEIYSRFRGILDATIETFVADQADYTLGATVFHIVEVYWNDTYPSADVTDVTESLASERYDNPALRLVDKAKQALQRDYADIDRQNWFDYYSDPTTHKLNLNPIPTTNIIIEYRKLFTTSNFPQNDKNLLKTLFKVKMLEYVMSTAQVSSLGDVTFNNKGMEQRIAKLKFEFYGAIQPVRMGRT